jgi:ABC-type multidrug transport system fused ATPase/permease subunit
MKEDEDIKPDIKSGLPDLWRLLQPFHKEIWLILGIVVLVEASGFIGPYILKIIIDKITAFSATEISALLWLVGGYFISQQGSSLIEFWQDRRAIALLINVEYFLPIEAQKKMLNLGLGYHELENTGNKIVKIERGIYKISELIGSLFWDMAPVVFQLLLALVILEFINWRFTVSLLVFAPIFIFVTLKANKSLRPLRTKRYKEYEVASGKMGQAIININAVQSFVQEEREVREYDAIKSRVRGLELKEYFKMLNFGIGRSFIIDLGRLTALALGVYLLASGQISIGSLVFAITMSEKVYFSLFRLNRAYDKASEGMVGAHRFTDLIKRNEEIANPSDGLRPEKITGDIEFRDVGFVYKNAEQAALERVNFKIPAGSFTALVGLSGSGKTTIARLLYRHYDPSSGVILLDGLDLKTYDLYAFRKFLAIVPQEVEIFDISIKDNIAYARPDASLEAIQEAARIANAEEFINDLKDGYDTLVGERGVKLSGGQRQRLGIARAILADPKVLIFDEATSNLDSKSERLIQGAIDKISHKRTLIVIAHRLSTIRKADQIIVLEKGGVKEIGTHVELSRANDGLYAELLRLQTMGEILTEKK